MGAPPRDRETSFSSITGSAMPFSGIGASHHPGRLAHSSGSRQPGEGPMPRRGWSGPRPASRRRPACRAGRSGWRPSLRREPEQRAAAKAEEVRAEVRVLARAEHGQQAEARAHGHQGRAQQAVRAARQGAGTQPRGLPPPTGKGGHPGEEARRGEGGRGKPDGVVVCAQDQSIDPRCPGRRPSTVSSPGRAGAQAAGRPARRRCRR